MRTTSSPCWRRPSRSGRDRGTGQSGFEDAAPGQLEMNEKQTNTMPKEMASAANLMVHPLAGAAALSALGVGLASQTFGIWMGAWAGAAEVSQRLFLPDDAAGGASGSARQARKAEAAAAKADETRALIEKTKALAAAKARPAPAGKPPREKAVAAAKVVPIPGLPPGPKLQASSGTQPWAMRPSASRVWVSRTSTP